MQTTKAAYKAKIEAQLAQWSFRIEGFKAKAEKATAGAKVVLLAQLAELVSFENAAKEQIVKLEVFAVDNWHNAMAGFEEGWSKLSGSLDAVWAKIKDEPVKSN